MTAIFTAISGSVLSILSSVGKLILKIILLLVALTALVPILPDDPFREGIVTVSGTWAEWADVINWIIPSQLILTSFFFGLWCYWAYFAYKLIVKTWFGNIIFSASQISPSSLEDLSGTIEDFNW